jgi:multiple sugar transport system permease protein
VMNRREFYGFAGPCIAVMGILLIAPLLYTAYLSLQHLTFGGVARYVGWQNYRDLLTNDTVWGAVGFTLLYVLLTLPVHTMLGLLLSLLLERTNDRLRSILISAYAMPFIMTPVVGTLLFSWLFKDHWGLLSYFLGLLHVHILWFSNEWAARVMVMLWGIWWTYGFNVMVIYAGLQTLPEEQHQAAIVDGANYWQRLRYIVLPHLVPYLVLITVFNVIDGLRIFDSIWVMTKGGPGNPTETVAYLTYHTSFVLRQLGKGSALSMLSVIGTLIVIAPLLYARRRVNHAR